MGLDHFDLATPTDIDAIRDGQPTTWERDKLAFTFDDGYADHYRAACWLSDRSVAATFFVVPSFIGRSIPEYLEFHHAVGFAPSTSPSTRGRDVACRMKRSARWWPWGTGSALTTMVTGALANCEPLV